MRRLFKPLGVGLCIGLAVLVSAIRAEAQNLLPNPGFESGSNAPAGWTLSAGEGRWVSPGHTGQRALAVTGDGKNSFYWRSEDLTLVPGQVYQLRFWGRCDAGVGGGCVTTGPSRVNHDFRFTETWQQYRFIFTVPAEGPTDFIRLGQWEQKGTVYFDDVELTPLTPVYTRFANGLELGDGESIEDGVYRSALNLGGASGNSHRTLSESRCGFNSDRWTFSAGQQVAYAYRIPGGFTKAQLKLGLNYYMGGTLKIEASGDGSSWQPISTLDGDHRNAQVDIPNSALGADGVFVRLTGEGTACNLQVNGSELEATLKKAVPDARGKTLFFETKQTAASIVVRPLNVRWEPAGQEFVFAVSVTNTTTTSLELQALVKVDGLIEKPVAIGTLAPGEARVTPVAIKPLRSGAQAVVLAVNDSAGRTLFSGETQVKASLLQDPRPGEWLADGPDVGVWWCESGWKIGRDHRLPHKPKKGPAQPVALSAARGEYEAVQVILNTQKATDLLKATIGPLRDAEGRPGAISAEMLVVAYVKVTHPTDSTCEAGWYPDPLPPLRLPLKLAPSSCQPLWLSFHVDRTAVAGDYKTELELKTSGGTVTVPVELHVYDFELPQETHLKSALGLNSHQINHFHHLQAAADQRRVYESYLTNFAAHRIAPYAFYEYAQPDIRFDGEGTNKHARIDFADFDREAAKWLDEYRMTTFALPLHGMGGGTFQSRSLGELEGFKEGTPEHARLFKDYLSQFEDHLRQHGWLDKAFTYWFDEPDRKDFEFVVEGMDRIRAAAPGIRRMLTKEPNPELMGHVDIWCGLTPEWSPEKVKARRAAGEEVWWYICCGPTAPYLTEFIDHPGTELRLWPWQSWQYGVQGLLIWETTYWTSDSAFPPPRTQDPWQDPMSYVSGYDFKPGHVGYWGNGDGRFLYPPRGATNDSPCLESPVTSFRWENLRDGMEDYEYLWLLQQSLARNRNSTDKSALIDEAANLLQIPGTISRDTQHFTDDPRLILCRRDRIARLIEKLR